MQRSLAVVRREKGSPAETRAGPPALVQEAMLDLLAICPRQSWETDEVRVRVLRIWKKGTERFEPEIVAEGFNSLVFRNPRVPFLPAPEDIVQRCEQHHRKWITRIEERYVHGTSSEALPAWCVRLADKVLRGHLTRWTNEAKQGRQDPYSPGGHTLRGFPQEFSADEQVGWYLAGKLGALIADWPPDLLREFSVPTGPELARLRGIVETDLERRERRVREERERVAAEQEETARAKRLRQEALAAALDRTDVKQLLEAKRAAESLGHKSHEARTAHEAFAAVYRPAALAELKARGLSEHHL